MFRFSSLLTTIYLIVGLIVAADHHYLQRLHTLRAVVSAVLAIVLWPLVLLGVNVHIRG